MVDTATMLKSHPTPTTNSDKLAACIDACRETCMSHADMHEHCELCGQSCQDCERKCNDLLSTLPAV